MRNLHITIGSCVAALAAAGCSSGSTQTTDEKFSAWVLDQAPAQVEVVETRCAQEVGHPDETCYMTVDMMFHGTEPARGEFYCKVSAIGDFAPECPGVEWLSQNKARNDLASIFFPDTASSVPDACAGAQNAELVFCLYGTEPAGA